MPEIEEKKLAGPNGDSNWYEKSDGGLGFIKSQRAIFHDGEGNYSQDGHPHGEYRFFLVPKGDISITGVFGGNYHILIRHEDGRFEWVRAFHRFNHLGEDDIDGPAKLTTRLLRGRKFHTLHDAIHGPSVAALQDRYLNPVVYVSPLGQTYFG